VAGKSEAPAFGLPSSSRGEKTLPLHEAYWADPADAVGDSRTSKFSVDPVVGQAPERETPDNGTAREDMPPRIESPSKQQAWWHE